MAGALFAGLVGHIVPEQFDLTLSLMVLAAVAIGGRWGLLGVVGGALLVAMYDRVLVDAVSAGAARARRTGRLVVAPGHGSPGRQLPGLRPAALPRDPAPRSIEDTDSYPPSWDDAPEAGTGPDPLTPHCAQNCENAR